MLMFAIYCMSVCPGETDPSSVAPSGFSFFPERVFPDPGLVCLRAQLCRLSSPLSQTMFDLILIWTSLPIVTQSLSKQDQYVIHQSGLSIHSHIWGWELEKKKGSFWEPVPSNSIGCQFPSPDISTLTSVASSSRTTYTNYNTNKHKVWIMCYSPLLGFLDLEICRTSCFNSITFLRFLMLGTFVMEDFNSSCPSNYGHGLRWDVPMVSEKSNLELLEAFLFMPHKWEI